MSEFFNLMPALVLGMLLGAFFFGGLWWTVRKAIVAKHVALLFIGSMLLRTAVVLTGFYFVLGENWLRLIAGLLGFIIARLIVTRLTRLTQQTGQSPQKESHAP